MTYFMALIIALSALFNTGAQAPLSPLSQAPITAPSQALTYEAPKVGTVPAPEAPEAPSQALSQAPQCEEDMPCWDCKSMGSMVCGNWAPQAPVTTQAPSQAPRKGFTPTAPVTIPDHAEPAPVQPVQAPVTPCKAPTLMAEDGSCVNPNFWDEAPEFGTDAPFVFEDSRCPVVHPLEGGHGAWAGAGLTCQIVKGK